MDFIFLLFSPRLDGRRGRVRVGWHDERTLPLSERRVFGSVLSQPVYRMRTHDWGEQGGLWIVHETTRGQREKDGVYQREETIAHLQSSGCADTAFEEISSKFGLFIENVCFSDIIGHQKYQNV